MMPFIIHLPSFDHFTAVSDVGLRPTRDTCLTAGLSGGFSRGSSVFASGTDWPVFSVLKRA